MSVATPDSASVAVAIPPPAHRRIAYRTRGSQHGPIIRLASPGELGKLIKPFVFLDYIDVAAGAPLSFGFHPHSGIATLTLMLDGGFSYEDSTGASGTMNKGSVEWMQAGGGVWHGGSSIGDRINGYQLWIALPKALENAPSLSRYLGPEHFARKGPARVVLGTLGDVSSPIDAPSQINYLDVQLKAGEVWRYQPPLGHDVAWIAVHQGSVTMPERVSAGELAVFAESELPITFMADGDAAFVLGSAVKHPHDLVLGNYSVHTNPEALKEGQNGIRRIANDLRSAGKM